MILARRPSALLQTAQRHHKKLLVAAQRNIKIDTAQKFMSINNQIIPANQITKITISKNARVIKLTIQAKGLMNNNNTKNAVNLIKSIDYKLLAFAFLLSPLD
jgi:hypothetical protein